MTVYTDESGTNTVTNSASGIVIFTPVGERHKFSEPTGKYCTNYAADLETLVYGIGKAEENRGECQQDAIFTDAKSVLEARAGDKLPDLTMKLRKNFSNVTELSCNGYQLTAEF